MRRHIYDVNGGKGKLKILGMIQDNGTAYRWTELARKLDVSPMTIRRLGEASEGWAD